MALKRSRGTQNPLELHAGDDIRVFAVAISLVYFGVKGLKSWSEDDGPHFELMDLSFLL